MSDVGMPAYSGHRGRWHGQMGGLKPVVAIYSTSSRAGITQGASSTWACLNLPLLFVFRTRGITGDDGPSHHGVLDIACVSLFRT